MTNPIVTLTTDFGQTDPFVATVKGTLLTECPGVQLIDLSHDLPRADAMEAGLFTAKAIPHFPTGTIHLVAVGSGPAPLLVSLGDQFVACPDSGLLTLLARQHPIEEIRALPVPEAARATGRQIMFARDVFAPAIAELAKTGSLATIGEPRDTLHLLDIPEPSIEEDRIWGRVIHIDGYGNLVSNIHQSFLEDHEVTRIEIGDLPLDRIDTAYNDVPTGAPLALFGSSDHLEIAYNGLRADERLALGKGVFVKVWIEPR